MQIFVGNLSFDAGEEDVRRLFAALGDVALVSLVTEKKGGKSRGFCFVDMPDDRQANEAITELNGKDFMGRPINVCAARPREAKREERPRRPERPRHAETPRYAEKPRYAERPARGERPRHATAPRPEQREYPRERFEKRKVLTFKGTGKGRRSKSFLKRTQEAGPAPAQPYAGSKPWKPRRKSSDERDKTWTSGFKGRVKPWQKGFEGKEEKREPGVKPWHKAAEGRSKSAPKRFGPKHRPVRKSE